MIGDDSPTCARPPILCIRSPTTALTLTTATTLVLSQFMFQGMEINLTCASSDEVSKYVELHNMHCYYWTGPLICSFKYRKRDIQGKDIIIENVKKYSFCNTVFF